jgi:OOP family OmpA-OmpF porin
MPPIRIVIATLVCVACAGGVQAQTGAQPVKPLAAASSPSKTGGTQRNASLPARGLFTRDQLSETAKTQLTELILNALGLQVEVALVVPTGPWDLEGSGKDERDLTPARLASVKRFLAERGVDPQKIFVESRLDEKIKEPRLDLQILGRPAND